MPGGFGGAAGAALDMLGSTWDAGVNLGVNTILSNDQRNWNKQMYDYMNEYNKPLNQKKRYQEASINPYAALTQGAISSGNSSSAPEGVAPPYGDYSPGMSGISDRISQRAVNEAQERAFNSEALLKETDAKTRNLRNVTEIANMKKQGLISDEEYQRLLNDNSAFDVRLQNEIRAADDAHDLAEFEKSSKDIILRYLPKINEAQLNVLLASASDLYSSAKAHNADALLKGAQKFTEDARKEGIEIDNETSRAIQDDLIDKAKQEANEAYWRSEKTRSEASTEEESFGIGKLKVGTTKRTGSKNASDPDHRSVHYDKHGPYLLDPRNEYRKIYLNGYTGQ